MSDGQWLLYSLLCGMSPPKGLDCKLNHRPVWLNGLELDIYYPDLKLALEFQGDQHFVQISAFNGSLAKTKANDKRKADLCAANDVTLIKIDASQLRYQLIVNKLQDINKIRSVQFPLRVNYKTGAKLDAKCHQYRVILNNRFQSPSIHKHGTWTRWNAIKTHHKR